MKKYKNIHPEFKKGAQVIGERVEYLTEVSGGEIQAPDLVEDGKPRSSPLHPYFEWSNKRASKNWRLHQARRMLNGTVEVIVIEGKKHECKSFFNVLNVAKERVYVSLETAISNKVYTKQLMEDCERYIQHFLGIIKLLKGRIK